MSTSRLSRLRCLTLAALCGLTLVPVLPAMAGHCGCETACVNCPPGNCDCPGDCAAAGCGAPPACGCEAECGCPPGYYLRCRRPIQSTLAYKTLAGVAGGIEKLLGIHRLCCDTGCCDTGCCEPGCCESGVGSMALPMPPADGPHLHSAPAHQPHPAPQPAAPAAPDHWQSTPQWQDVPGPRSEMEMGQPRMVEPVPQPEPQPDPFRDDARVSSKSKVRHSNYHRASHRRPPQRSRSSHYRRPQPRRPEPVDVLPRKQPRAQSSNPKQRYSRTF